MSLFLIKDKWRKRRKSCTVSKWMACEHLYTMWIFSNHSFMKWLMISMGRGKMMVEFFSAAMVLRVWRYLSWRADGDSAITRDASFRALDAFISPSAAITYINTNRYISVWHHKLYIKCSVLLFVFFTIKIHLNIH